MKQSLPMCDWAISTVVTLLCPFLHLFDLVCAFLSVREYIVKEHVSGEMPLIVFVLAYIMVELASGVMLGVFCVAQSGQLHKSSSGEVTQRCL